MKTIYYNGRIWTGSLPLQEAFAVEEGRFTFVGSDREALSLRAEGDLCHDLKGAFVCPGFIDSHMHLLNYGQALSAAPLHAHTGSLAEMLSCLRSHWEERGLRGGWLIGRGWNQDYFSDVSRMPDRWDLDKVSAEFPICAVRACGHALSVNSKALELLNITARTPQPEGGEIVMEDGVPNGILLDNAMDLAYRAIPLPTRSELKEMLLAACRAVNSYGITSCHSDDYCVFPSLPWQEVNAAFQELEEEGKLTVRVYEQANFTDLEGLKGFLAAGNNTGAGSDRFKIGPLKLLGDGSLGSRTAFLSQPYADAPHTTGIPVFSQKTLDEMIGLAHANGMQTAVHAIGDGCLDRVLSAMEEALSAHPRTDHRHGIVHCQITRPDQLKKMAELGLHIYAQSIFLDYDIHIVEQRVGEALASSSYCWKTLKDTGATLSNGSDCPVELPLVMGGIQCAVTRSTLDGSAGPYLPHQALTVEEALRSYTSGGAYAAFEENAKGKIAPGMLADFVILGGDPFETPAKELKDIPVLGTWLGGSPVFMGKKGASL